MRKLEKEEKKEVFQYGLAMGCTFFISNVIYLGLQKDQQFMVTMMPWLGALLAGYLLLGIAFFFFYLKLSGKDFAPAATTPPASVTGRLRRTSGPMVRSP